jgi:hypothetical protein
MAAGTTLLNSPWSRLANTTIRDYVRGEELNILRNRKLPALLKKRGRITYDHPGIAMDWKVRYRRAPMIGFADGDTVTFSRQDRHKTAALDWRGYSLSDAMTKGEYLQNRSTEAIIKLFDTRTKMLLEDAEDQFAEQFYVDGTMPANIKYMYGLETFLNYSTQVVGNGAMKPTATYAGINCTLGTYGGSWSAPISGNLTWPNGRGDGSYDFWAPLIVDVGDTFFGNGSSAYWGANGTNPVSCVEAISFAIIKSKKMPSKKGALDLFLLNDVAYQQYITQLRSLQRIVVSGQTSELIGLGFDDVVQQDGGKDVSYEYGLPVSSSLNNNIGVIGYGLNVDQMELCSQQSEVWVPEGPSFDDATKTWRWSIDSYIQLKCDPKFQVKLFNYTNSADTAQM